jgi:hypothetical protein
MRLVQRSGLLSAIFLAVGLISAYSQLPFQIQENYISGLSSPVFLTNAGDGSRRLFIVQQRGIIKVAQPGSNSVTDYLNISSVVSSTGGERGLLGLAFHPNFENNRRFFVYYTRQSDGAVQIAEYAQNASNPNIADPNPVSVIITIPHPTFSNHNGGTIAFGPDGYLYAGPGDGGSGGDPIANSQNTSVLLGKIIRLDINSVSPPLNYSIPPTNPFAGAIPGADEIFAYGLRNPYRFSFDRGGTNQLWVGDVGENITEEVDIIVNGGNYGWRVYEGTRCTGLDPQLCEGGATPIAHVPPVFEYGRVLDTTGVTRCSVTGGYVYRGRQRVLPAGSYIYGDYCTGQIMKWDGAQQTILADTSNFNLVSFGEDEDGELYVVRQSGSIARIVGSRTNADFDGDGASDLSVFRPSSGDWFAYSPVSNSFSGLKWGLGSDIPTPEDYDGDGKTDFAVFRPSEGAWYVFRSRDSTVQAARWGINGDIPVPGDYDGDRRADVAVYRPSERSWYVINSNNQSYFGVRFGLPTDIPVNADYDGDGKNDIAIWRPSDGVWWWIKSSNGQVNAYKFGQTGDVPAQGDYDGDGRTDHAVYRPAQGEWYVTRSSDSSIFGDRWGIAEDVPVPGDYDRDGRDDIAVWRPSSGTWWIIRSSDQTYAWAQFGLSGDIPIAANDAP